MNELISLFKKYQKKGNNSTHSVIPDKNTKYSFLQHGYSLDVPLKDIDTFNKEINRLVFDENIYISLTETFGKVSPLFIDIDLKYNDISNTNRRYTDNTIKQIVLLVREQVKKYIKYEDEKSLEVWITEKENPVLYKDKNIVKDGIHIIFPNIIGDSDVYKYNFLKIFSENTEIKNKIIEIFKSTSVNNEIPDNDISDIFDGNVVKWFTYGCGKANNYPHLLTKIIQNDDEDFVDNYYDTDEIINKLCLLQEFEKNISYKNNIETLYNKPKSELSKSSSNTSLAFMDSSDDDDEIDEDYDPYYTDVVDTSEIIETLKNAEKDNIRHIVLECLSDKRYNEYELWSKIGMCLKNIGGDQLFDLWVEFSEKSSDFESEEICKKFWDGFKKEGLSRGSLNYWAKMDNPKKYYELIEKNLKNKIEQSIFKKGSHDDIAEVIYGLYKDEFICADLKDNWYYFNGSKWVDCPKGWKLHSLLTKGFKEIYYKYHFIYKKEMDRLISEGNEVDAESYDKRQKYAYGIYEQLKCVTFQKNIMEACRLKFYVEKALDKMDSNPNLIGFNNCVFDLVKCEIREGRPEDYITMSTNLELPIHQNELPLTVSTYKRLIKERVGKFKHDEKGVREMDKSQWDNGDKKFYHCVKRDIKKFFEQILPNQEMRKYCIKFIASRLSGNVLDQRFSIITGCGANGKSILIDLIRQVFGEYCVNLPVTLLTQKRKASNAASPEKARTKGVRLCYMQEPDSGEKINAGEMKELSGGDVITARKLYGDVFSFKPQFEMLLMCNEKPIIDDKTNGAWRRVQVYPFVSRFVEDEKLLSDENNIYKMDKKLSQTLQQWPEVFMAILFQEFEKMDGGMNEDEIPMSIRMETEAYKNQNDIIGTWRTQDLIESSDTVTPFKELYIAFEQWHGENYSSGKTDSIVVKKRLLEWQKNNYRGGFTSVNGTDRYPLFNLKIIEE